MEVYALETVEDDEVHGVCGVFSTREAALAGAVAMAKRAWLNYENVHFTLCKMSLDDDNHTFDPTNVFHFEVEGDETFEVEYCSWNGWVRK